MLTVNITMGDAEMNQQSIANAISTFTAHVRQYADLIVSNVGVHPTDDEKAAQRVAVESVCGKMEALPADDESSFTDFERLRHSMGTQFPATPPSYLSDVADAFGAAGRLDAKR